MLPIRSLLALTAAALASVASAQEKSVEEDLEVHRYKLNHTAPWDAFEYMNRLAANPGEGESAKDFAGRIIGNIANVEGRILVKVPTGMDRTAYDGFKMFFNTTGEGAAANCASCHVGPNFDGPTTHKSASGGDVTVPPLRNLSKAAPYFEDKSAATLEDVIRAKIAVAKQARDAADAGDPEYKNMILIEEDIAPLVAFLKQFEGVDKEKFRELILTHTILDTSDLF